MNEVVVAGVGTTKFGGVSDTPNYVIAIEAVLKALKDSGFSWKEMQAAFSGSVYQGTGSGHQVFRELGLSNIPIVNVENACSSGSSAIRLAYESIASGQYDVAIALGFEKMPKGPIASTAFRDWQLKMGMNVQPANYALETQEYMKAYGATIDDISSVTIKNRKHGALNPNARFQKEVTLEEINNSRMISTPLRLFHCSPIADGATCLVLCNKEKVKDKNRSVTILAAELTSGVYGESFYQNGMVGSPKNPPKQGFVQKSATDAYNNAGLGPADIDVIQAYDSMASGELWDLEHLGFCKPGEAPRLLREGYFSLGGKQPSNTDGGLMSRGHPLGATAAAQIYELVLQLRGEAGPRQVENAKIALSHSIGAGPNSTVTILGKE